MYDKAAGSIFTYLIKHYLYIINAISIDKVDALFCNPLFIMENGGPCQLPLPMRLTGTSHCFPTNLGVTARPQRPLSQPHFTLIINLCATPIATLQNLQRLFVQEAYHDLYVGTINRTRLELIQPFHFTFLVSFLVSFDSTSNNIQLKSQNFKCSNNI